MEPYDYEPYTDIQDIIRIAGTVAPSINKAKKTSGEGSGYMSSAEVANIVRDSIWTIIMVSLPMLGIGLIVGVVISIIQATTQINEQTIVFASKIIAIFLTLIFFGSWILTQLQDFTYRVFNYMLQMMG